MDASISAAEPGIILALPILSIRQAGLLSR
jgi:hypothetical protein